MSLHQFTIPELTGYEYKELKYSAVSLPIVFGFILQIRQLLNKAGIFVNTDSKEYDAELSNKVKEFQSKNGLNDNGILDTTTLQTLIRESDKKSKSDVIEEDEEETSNTDNSVSTNPHYNSFFNEDNYKTFRKNRKNIKIVLGNNSNTKTIIDVFFRSQTVEYDTSGNPISEVYEFIAKDIKESDEINDLDKYTTIYESTSSSDVQYIYNEVEPMTEGINA